MSIQLIRSLRTNDVCARKVSAKDQYLSSRIVRLLLIMEPIYREQTPILPRDFCPECIAKCSEDETVN